MDQNLPYIPPFINRDTPLEAPHAMAVALMSSPVLRAALADPLLGPDLLWKLDACSSSDTVPSTPRLIPGRWTSWDWKELAAKWEMHDLSYGVNFTIKWVDFWGTHGSTLCLFISFHVLGRVGMRQSDEAWSGYISENLMKLLVFQEVTIYNIYYIILYYIILYLYYIISYYIILYYMLFHYIILLYFFILYCIKVYSIILYHTILYYIILYYSIV